MLCRAQPLLWAVNSGEDSSRGKGRPLGMQSQMPQHLKDERKSCLYICHLHPHNSFFEGTELLAMGFLISIKYKYFVMPSGVSRLQSRGKSYKQDWERNPSQVTHLKKTMTMSCSLPAATLATLARTALCQQSPENQWSFLPEHMPSPSHAQPASREEKPYARFLFSPFIPQMQ